METFSHHFLLPGSIFVKREEHLVMTVLGSCISVCLWDKVRNTGGINHFMLPLWNGEGLPTPKYGDIAIELLIRKMLDLGCRKESMVAKVFGGASMIANSTGMFAIGDRNLNLAQQLLAGQGIPVVASETGGNSGRRIIFNTFSGVVFLKKTADKNVPSDLAKNSSRNNLRHR